jgi:ectoine hydroxylase-related dioxygenase (phytanoyl-CoA dioxygenase family)
MLTSLMPVQVEHFKTHGYVAVRDFWDAREVAAMQAELERLKEEGLLRNVATDGDGKTHSKAIVNLQLCPMYNKSDFFRAMPFAPKVIASLSQLIGDPFLLHLDQVFLKPGRHGSGTNWHQDNAYFKISDPMKGAALWTAVHDATIANGTMHIIPDSVYEVFEHSRDPYSDHHIRCYPPEERAIPIELPAGGVLFFAYGIAHCTRGNTTDRERAGMAMHFLRADYAQDDLIDPARDTRPYLTGPLASGGLREYGVKVAGTWDQEVERLLNSKWAEKLQART